MVKLKKLPPTATRPVPTPKVSTQDKSGREYTYIVEPELAGAGIPRLAMLATGNIGTRRLLWNVMLVCIGLIGFFWRRDYDTWNDLIAHGVVTEATVYNKFSNNSRTTSSFHLCYSFQTDTRKVYGAHDVTDEVYKKIEIGAKLPVTYLPKRQGRIWQKGIASTHQRDLQSSYWSGAAFLVILGFGFAIYTSKAQSLREIGLLREGIAVRGQVQSGEVIRGKQTLHLLRYKYGVGGSTRTDEIKVTAQQYQALTQGNPYFTVLYDAIHPSRNMPYFQITGAYLIAAKESFTRRIAGM